MVDFIKEAETIQQQVVLWRRDLHQCPELLLDLPKTSAYVERELQKMGYETERICQSGLTTVLDSGKPGKTLLLRADMDALPIQEESGLPYASRTPGVSHACGHDTHMAILLGAARLLHEHRHEFCGKIKFMFQPGEEGGGGARLMIQSGILENPKVDACMGFHQVVARDHLPTGTVGYTKGAMMASADIFQIRVYGKSAHEPVLNPSESNSDFDTDIQCYTGDRMCGKTTQRTACSYNRADQCWKSRKCDSGNRLHVRKYKGLRRERQRTGETKTCRNLYTDRGDVWRAG